MSAISENLMSGGKLPAGAAFLLGASIGTLAGAGTTQGAATAIGTVNVVLATTASSQDSFVLPANAPLGWVVEFYNTSSTAANVFPDTGSSIDGGTATTGSVAVAQNKGRYLRKVSATAWKSIYNT